MLTPADLARFTGLSDAAAPGEASVAARVVAAGAARAEAEVDHYAPGAAGVTGEAASEAVTHATALLALAHALPVLNLRFTEGGGVVSSVGWDASRQQLASAADLDRRAASLRRDALGVLRAHFALTPRAFGEPPPAPAGSYPIPSPLYYGL